MRVKAYRHLSQTAPKAAVGLMLLALTNGCSHHASPSAQQASGYVLRIGYGKGGSMDIVRRQGTLAKRLAPQGVAVEWITFPQGPQMMEGIGAGNVDLGAAASTPPLFAQAAGVPFVYAANIPPGKSVGGILVPKDSPIHTLHDLQGKRIAFQPGSVWQYDLVKFLEQGGLKYRDVQPAKMPPADAFAAFNSGSVDAWVQGEPYLTLAERKSGARLLADTSTIPNDGGFYLAAASTVKAHPELIEAALDEIQKAGQWAAKHPHDAAVLTASDVGLDVPTLEKMIAEGNDTRLKPVDSRTVALQQEQADLFETLHVLPRHIEVQQTVLSPQEYAKLLPGREK